MGDWSAPRRKGPARDRGQRRLLPEIASLPLRGRHVFVVFDSDARGNRHVAGEERALAAALRAAGAGVRTVRLPACGREKVGLDDFLAAAGPDAFRELLARAEPAPADLVARGP